MSAFDPSQLSPEQQELVAAHYLSELAEQATGRLPYEIFQPVSQLVVLNTVEVGFVKPSPTDERHAQVLLTQRPATDKHWADQWHIPGSVVLPTDPVKHEHDYDAAIGRVTQEVGGGLRMGDFVEYDTVRRKGSRGSEVTVRFMNESQGSPARGRFFDARRILVRPPEGGLIETHAEAIEKLAATYHDLKS